MHLLRNCQYLQSWPTIIYVDEAVRSEREQRNRRLQQRRRVFSGILFCASEVVRNRGRMANLDQAIHGGLGRVTHKSGLFGNRWQPQTTALRRLDYIEFIGAKKHLVLAALSYTGPPIGATG